MGAEQCRSRAIIILIIEARSFCILFLHTCESYDFHYGSQHLRLIISSGSFSGLEYFHTRMHLLVLSWMLWENRLQISGVLSLCSSFFSSIFGTLATLVSSYFQIFPTQSLPASAWVDLLCTTASNSLMAIS